MLEGTSGTQAAGGQQASHCNSLQGRQVTISGLASVHAWTLLCSHVAGFQPVIMLYRLVRQAGSSLQHYNLGACYAHLLLPAA